MKCLLSGLLTLLAGPLYCIVAHQLDFRALITMHSLHVQARSMTLQSGVVAWATSARDVFSALTDVITLVVRVVPRDGLMWTVGCALGKQNLCGAIRVSER